MADLITEGIVAPAPPPPPPPQPRKRVAFTAPTVASSTGPSPLDTVDFDPLQLWFQEEEVRIAKLESRVEATAYSGLQKRSRRVSVEQYGGRRPAAEGEPPATIQAVGACGSPTLRHTYPPLGAGGSSIPPNLCLMRASMGGLEGSSGSSNCSSPTSPPPTAATAAAAAAATGAATAGGGGAGPPSGICLQRAATFNTSAPEPLPVASVLPHRASSAAAAPGARPSNRNPSGLTMSQRVAALQLGFRAQALGQPSQM